MRDIIYEGPLRTGALNIFAPWTPKKNLSTPKVSIDTTCKPLNRCKRGLNG